MAATPNSAAIEIVMHAHQLRHPSSVRLAGARCLRRLTAVVNASAGNSDPFSYVSAERGFLPVQDPIERLSSPAAGAWEDAMRNIPKLVVAGGANGLLRRTLTSLPPFPITEVVGGTDIAQLWRAYTVLSFLAHAYMWCETPGPEPQGGPPQRLPAALAVPWVAVARALDMPPVLVYATYNLYNWRRIDPAGPVELGNIVCLHNFMASTDEEWFRLVHVDIEARAAAGLRVLHYAKHAASQHDAATVERSLGQVASTLRGMQASLARMGEKCDPYVYYTRVRQPMSGWRNNPVLPNGLLYEGVQPQGGMNWASTTGGPEGEALWVEEAAEGGTIMRLYGETGAQSSIVPAFDTLLGVVHEEDWLKAYLRDMRGHMPPAHRAHLDQLAVPLTAGPSVRQLCAASSSRSLRAAYNDAITELEKFRSQHKGFAYTYIAKYAKQEQQRATTTPAVAPAGAAGGRRSPSPEAQRGMRGNPAAGTGQAGVGSGEQLKGTGGSDFMPALQGYRDTTSRHVLPQNGHQGGGQQLHM